MWCALTSNSSARGHLLLRCKKNTCGSTVFSTGHPRQYSLAPAMLVCADRTRRGRFIAVWPQITFKVSTVNIYPSNFNVDVDFLLRERCEPCESLTLFLCESWRLCREGSDVHTDQSRSLPVSRAWRSVDVRVSFARSDGMMSCTSG